jgi:hypothetical protein
MVGGIEKIVSDAVGTDGGAVGFTATRGARAGRKWLMDGLSGWAQPRLHLFGLVQARLGRTVLSGPAHQAFFNYPKFLQKFNGSNFQNTKHFPFGKKFKFPTEFELQIWKQI